jgi:hypothetical protein
MNGASSTRPSGGYHHALPGARRHPELAVPPSRHSSAVLQRARLLRPRLACAQGAHREHGHPDCARLVCGVLVQRRAAGVQPARPRLLRDRRGNHCAHPARQVPGGARKEPDQRGHPRADRAPAQDRPRTTTENQEPRTKNQQPCRGRERFSLLGSRFCRGDRHSDRPGPQRRHRRRAAG